MEIDVCVSFFIYNNREHIHPSYIRLQKRTVHFRDATLINIDRYQPFIFEDKNEPSKMDEFCKKEKVRKIEKVSCEGSRDGRGEVDLAQKRWRGNEQID